MLRVQALENECEQLRQAAMHSAAELAEERRRGISKERKLMDRSQEAAKLREQLQEADSTHQVQHLSSSLRSSFISVSAQQELHLAGVCFRCVVAQHHFERPTNGMQPACHDTP